MKKELKEIKVCENCQTPLLFTFRWDYSERYCLNCGALGDMFLGEYAPLTKELRAKEKLVNKIWSALYGKQGFLLPASGKYKKKNCKKCEVEEYHGSHLTRREKLGNQITEKILKRVKFIYPKS